MADFRDFEELHHSAMAAEIADEKKRRKARLNPVNEDFYKDLPYQLTEILDSIKWEYRNEPWFNEAWEKYRKHVLDAGLGGKIKMPGFVFNEYVDKYVEERSKRFPADMYNAIHSDCDVDELYHHGVKGQKWGVRRYQNDDGTLTEEGKKRYGVDSNGKMSKEGKKLYSQDRKEALKEAKTDLKDMGLRPNYLFRSPESQASKYNAGKLYVAENYGKTTVKDYIRSEKGREAATKGSVVLASVLASIGAMVVVGGQLKKVLGGLADV